MAGKSKRSAFGKIKAKRRTHGEVYYEVSYRTPPEAFSKWPNQPQDQYKPHGAATELEANGWLDEEKKALDGGYWEPVNVRKAKQKKASITFGEYATQWVENRKTKAGKPTASSTRIGRERILKNHLLPAFGHYCLADITPNVVNQWLDSFGGENLGARYNAYTLLKPIMDSAANDPIDEAGHTLIERNPCRTVVVRPRKKHKTVNASPEQLRKLYERMPDRLALSVYCTGFMGMRIGEVLALRREDIDLNAKTVHVDESLKPDADPTTGKQHIVVGDTKTIDSVRYDAIPEPLVPFFADHLKKYTGKGGKAFLFTKARSNDFITESNYNAYLLRARAGVPGLEDYWAHDGRHSTGARLLESGASKPFVAEALGHGDVRSTDTYLDNVSASHRKQVAEAYNAEIKAALTDDEPSQQQTENDRPSDSDTSASASPDSMGGNNDMKALSGALASMSLTVRVQVLGGLSEERRLEVLKLLPDGVAAETIAELFKAVQ